MDNYVTMREKIVNFNKGRHEIEDLVKKSLENEEDLVVLYIHRDRNYIKYGTLFHGSKVETNTIEMLSDKSLKIIYDSLKDEYKDDFSLGFSHDVLGKTFLKIWINEKVLIQIYSSHPYDVEWFGKEIDEVYNHSKKS